MKLKRLFQFIIWEIINPVLLKIKKNYKYSWGSKYIGLNIGCGLDNAANWAGIDGGITHYLIYHSPKFIARKIFKNFKMASYYSFDEYNKKIKGINFIHHDLRFGLPFKNNVVPNIYSSHFLEHLFERDAEILLKECFRVIKPGGIIRIVVPSLDNEVEEMSNAIEAYKNGDSSNIQKFVTTDIMGYISDYSNHRYMYNFTLLKKKLENAGFTNIREWEYRKGDLINVELLDTRKESLFAEAIKL